MVIFIAQKEYHRTFIPVINKKLMKADYPLYFINSVVNELQKGKECGDKSFIIPPSLSESNEIRTRNHLVCK